jgi:hypothetical protein
MKILKLLTAAAVALTPVLAAADGVAELKPDHIKEQGYWFDHHAPICMMPVNGYAVLYGRDIDQCRIWIDQIQSLCPGGYVNTKDHPYGKSYCYNASTDESARPHCPAGYDLSPSQSNCTDFEYDRAWCLPDYTLSTYYDVCIRTEDNIF